jgi:hypothetical protein
MDDRTGQGQEPEYRLVEVAAFHSDSRFRLVRLMGVGWEPMDGEEFERRVRRVFPDIDLNDPQQVHWADRPEPAVGVERGNLDQAILGLLALAVLSSMQPLSDRAGATARQPCGPSRPSRMRTASSVRSQRPAGTPNSSMISWTSACVATGRGPSTGCICRS